MIPKVIHYCWFGGKPLNQLGEKCLKSWKKMCPDYEIVRWDESNYDISKNLYMSQAYAEKKWGFVPDYARLDIIYNHGGIYLDTDVELLKSLDDLLIDPMFVGTESDSTIALGLGFGAEKGNTMIKEMMEQYNSISFINADGSLNLTASPTYQTNFFISKGFTQCKNNAIWTQNCKVYPKQFFNPTDMNSGRVHTSSQTISIHHYAASWESPWNRFRGKTYQLIYNCLGEKTATRMRKVFGRKKDR